MYQSVLSFVALVLFLGSAFGQSKQDKILEKNLDEMLSGTFRTTDPGCVVLISRNGKIIYKKAIGTANLELNVPVQPEMVFNLASITKQFTAVAILQLVEQGKIALQDSLQKYIPDYPFKGYTISIENLLTHTSGIKDYLQIETTGPFMERWDFRPNQLIDSFKHFPLAFRPGTRFSYSNSGYYLLGYIIEKISGKRYQDYVQENLLNPSGMSHSYFDSSGIIIPGRVSGYRWDGSAFKNVDYWSPTIIYAAGGLLSNAEDLLRWHTAVHSYTLLKKETMELAFTPYRLADGTMSGYGYGWYLKTANGIRSVEHQGGLPGFQTNAVYFFEEDLFIVALSNNGNAPITELSNRISAQVLNKPLQADIAVDKSMLDKYLGTYTLSVNTKRTITILRMNGIIVAKIAENEIVPLLFQSATKFQFKNLLNADCEFILENGRVTKFNVSQNGHYEWIKNQ